MSNLLADSLVHPENLANYRCSYRRRQYTFFSMILHLTIFNPEIGSTNAANLILTSCPSVIPSTLSAFGQIRFRRHGQFLYANLLITQRKHIGRVRYSLCVVCIPAFPLLSSCPPSFLPFSSLSVDSKRLPTNAPLEMEITENSTSPTKLRQGVY